MKGLLEVEACAAVRFVTAIAGVVGENCCGGRVGCLREEILEVQVVGRR